MTGRTCPAVGPVGPSRRTHVHHSLLLSKAAALGSPGPLGLRPHSQTALASECAFRAICFARWVNTQKPAEVKRFAQVTQLEVGSDVAGADSFPISSVVFGRVEPYPMWGNRPTASWAGRGSFLTDDQRSWVTGEASGESQKTAKDSELEIEFLIINKRQDQALRMEALGCLRPAWGAQEAPALGPQDSLVIVQTIGGTESWG